MKYAALICLVVSCVLLVSFLIVLFVTRRINTPLTDLTKAAKRIASGEEIELLQPYDIEELDNLVEAFDTMFFELRETTISKDYLNRIVDSLRECLLVTSLNGTIESSNRTALNLLGCTEEQLIGRHISTLFPEEFDIDAYPVGSEQHGEIETAFITFRGEKIPIVFFRSFIKSKEGDNLGIACLALDIRVRKKIEEEKESLKAQLYNAQRLETVGTLASGIAHDFNNILTIIIGYTQILQFTIKNAASAEPLKQILSASHRAKDLVQQLLEFSRQGSHPKMEISLVSIVKEIVKMLKSSTPASIEISQKVNPDCRTIVADPGQIQQIIMNLSSNAIHAMKDYGTLTIKLDNELINKLNADQYPGAPEERFVKLMVCDTGHGIQKKDIAHIFDPFFTTKTVDKGTGLGLSVVHGMIKSLQGHIFVKSEEGEGTTFTILLPATLDKDTTQEDSPLSAANHKLLQGSGERILFVDDEEALTKLEKINLESLGYRVTCTTSSQEALEFFRQEPTQFDLLITDFSMPKMRGDKLLQEIRRIRSDMPAILCTGYHAKLVPAEKINGAFRTIKKPYTNENMAKEVKEILASRGRE
jgi:PAS domain S-box-containing protein